MSSKLIKEVTVSELAYPIGAGISNETILLAAFWTDRVPRKENFVLRVHPGARQLFLDARFETQFELLTLLRDDGRVRVPHARWFERDREVLGEPFFVMDRMWGRVPVSMPVYNLTGWLADASVAERRKVWEKAMEQLVAIHTTPIEEVAFLDQPFHDESGFDQLWRYTDESYQWASAGRPVAVLEQAQSWLADNLPDDRPTGLGWGDARIGNMMFGDDFDVVGVMDWEQANLGGGIQDLAWWLFFDDLFSSCLGLERLDGLGGRQETIDMWKNGTGLSARDLHWYEVFTGYKVSIIYLRLAELEANQAPRSNRSNNLFTRHMCELLGLPEPPDSSK
jgi:aminoglycoside phosphotransferase (APT) family kinase protein